MTRMWARAPGGLWTSGAIGIHDEEAHVRVYAGPRGCWVVDCPICRPTSAIVLALGKRIDELESAARSHDDSELSGLVGRPVEVPGPRDPTAPDPTAPGNGRP